jgi:hypothetical protein
MYSYSPWFIILYIFCIPKIIIVLERTRAIRKKYNFVRNIAEIIRWHFILPRCSIACLYTRCWIVVTVYWLWTLLYIYMYTVQWTFLEMYSYSPWFIILYIFCIPKIIIVLERTRAIRKKYNFVRNIENKIHQLKM